MLNIRKSFNPPADTLPSELIKHPPTHQCHGVLRFKDSGQCAQCRAHWAFICVANLKRTFAAMGLSK